MRFLSKARRPMAAAPGRPRSSSCWKMQSAPTCGHPGSRPSWKFDQRPENQTISFVWLDSRIQFRTDLNQSRSRLIQNLNSAQINPWRESRGRGAGALPRRDGLQAGLASDSISQRQRAGQDLEGRRYASRRLAVIVLKRPFVFQSLRVGNRYEEAD